MKKILKYILITITIVAIMAFVYFYFFSKKEKPLNKTISQIEKYGYILTENKSSEYQLLFNDLQECLNKKEIDYQEYANIIAKLFIIDFYTLDNKVNNNDIGGLEFILSSSQDNFILNAKNSLYKYLKNDHSQVLPHVTNVEISSITNEAYSYQNKKDNNAYLVKAEVTYQKDLGYPEEITLNIIKDDYKLYIAEVK